MSDPWRADHSISVSRRAPATSRRRTLPGLLLLLYVTMLAVNPIRKIAGMPGSILFAVYIPIVMIYVYFLLRRKNRRTIRPRPRYIPLWTFMLGIWSLFDAYLHDIPIPIDLLGLVSYVFFVPLFYVGAEIMHDDDHAAALFRIVAVGGGIVGAGAIAGAFLKQSAPLFLQASSPYAAVHGSSMGNMYLAPSLFASAEQAAEHLLAALFALIALTCLPARKPGRPLMAVAGMLIACGLVAANRRADLYVAVAGIAAVLILRRISAHSAARSAADRIRPGTGSTKRVLALAVVATAALGALLGVTKLVSFISATGPVYQEARITFAIGTPYSLTGQGSGTSTQGATLLGAIPATQSTISRGTYPANLLAGRVFRGVEGGLSKSLIEIGVIGTVLYAAVFISALAPAVRAVNRIDDAGRVLLVFTIALGIIFLKGHMSLDDPLLQPLFWLAAGGVWARMPKPGHERQAERLRSGDPVAAVTHPSGVRTLPG